VIVITGSCRPSPYLYLGVGAYFVGKMAWQKGLDSLFILMKYLEKR